MPRRRIINPHDILKALPMRDKAQLFDALYIRGARNGLAVFLAPALEHAANVGNPDLVRKTLVAGACANTLETNGSPMLHLVAAAGNEKAVQALLDHGAVVDAQNSFGYTALHRVALNHRDCVGAATALLAAGANAGLRSSPDEHGRTPLQMALEFKCMDVIMALIRYGANIHDTSYDGETALYTAVRCRRDDAISVLVKAGADINAPDRYKGLTPLHVATTATHPDCVKTLCELGAEIDKRNGTGDTPLHYALTDPWAPRAVAVLLEAGADVNLRQADDDNFSALDLAAMYGHVNMLRRLIRHGADVTAADRKGNTALHHAAHWGQTTAIRVLVQAGANVDARDSEGQTPLHRASTRQAVRTADALLRHAASVNARDELGQRPLHLAVRKSREDSSAGIVERLLRSEADERAVDDDGRTAAAVVGLDAPPALPGGGLPGNPAVLNLLANAPAERIERRWRRRSFLVMCRSRPSRAPPMPPERADEASGRSDGMMTRKRARLAGVRGGGGGGVGANGGRGNAHRGAAECAARAPDLVATVVGMEADVLFRHVMAFL